MMLDFSKITNDNDATPKVNDNNSSDVVTMESYIPLDASISMEDLNTLESEIVISGVSKPISYTRNRWKNIRNAGTVISPEGKDQKFSFLINKQALVNGGNLYEIYLGSLIDYVWSNEYPKIHNFVNNLNENDIITLKLGGDSYKHIWWPFVVQAIICIFDNSPATVNTHATGWLGPNETIIWLIGKELFIDPTAIIQFAGLYNDNYVHEVDKYIIDTMYLFAIKRGIITQEEYDHLKEKKNYLVLNYETVIARLKAKDPIDADGDDDTVPHEEVEEQGNVAEEGETVPSDPDEDDCDPVDKKKLEDEPSEDPEPEEPEDSK